ncbi:hypothetical protein AYI70_g140 [Smittium culicis]|uniref:Uncharacterized protein n=1 Tax=Smittium culicis TaxID=133412 RepID=A0A1R1YI48_9FUNG|nr:hypothetical protein AYI70_g140 [Smittium culicis]
MYKILQLPLQVPLGDHFSSIGFNGKNSVPQDTLEFFFFFLCVREFIKHNLKVTRLGFLNFVHMYTNTTDNFIILRQVLLSLFQLEDVIDELYIS